MVDAKGLTIFYENMLALRHLSLKCGERQILGVFGANGAGKSTLMHTLSGIIFDIKKKEEMAGGQRITISGHILYNGLDITGMKTSDRARKGIILCPERRRIFPESSVMENLQIGSYLAPPKKAKETLHFVFDIFPPLLPLRKRLGGLLSGGEQQMLAIGRALMAQPSLLLLDEPLLGLSPLIQGILIHSIRGIKENRGISIIITEQYARPVIPIVDYGYILEDGSSVFQGERKELIKNPDIKSAYLGV